MTLLCPMSNDFGNSIIGIREEFESQMSLLKTPGGTDQLSYKTLGHK